jgi:hypothetical protein
MGKRSEQEPEAIRRYAEGMEIPRIADELGVSENSLRLWKKRAGGEWDEARAAFHKGRMASMEDVGRRVARVQEITGRINGDAASQGKMGQILNQGLQTMLYDVMGQMQTVDILDSDALDASITQLRGLATTLQRLEQSASFNLKREQEIRQKALLDAAALVTTSVKKGGLTDAAANEIRMKILGIGA